MKLRVSLVSTAVLISLPMLLMAQGKPQYVGAAACKACHLTPKSGAAFKIWQDGQHSKAFATLATSQSKEIAKKKGIADPQQSQDCLKCHETAAGAPAAQLAATFKPGEGVGCEVCHGPGSLYKSMKVMKQLDAKEIKGETVGFMLADEKFCLKCHNQESPTYKPFKFDEAKKKIAHATPKQ